MFLKAYPILFTILLLFFNVNAFAQESNFTAYYASLRSSEVNLRTGPGYRYPIDWVYKRRHLPVKVIDQFEHWRKLEDRDGTTGWIHKNLLSDRKAIVVVKDQTFLTRDPTIDSLPLAELEKGVVGMVQECRYEWCMVEVEPYEGWVLKSKVWGVEQGLQYEN